MALPNVSVSWLLQMSGGLLGTFGIRTTYGHLDTADEEFMARVGVIGARYSYTYPTGDLSGLTGGSTLTITDDDGDNTSYWVRQVIRQPDGTSVALLAEGAS